MTPTLPAADDSAVGWVSVALAGAFSALLVWVMGLAALVDRVLGDM